MQASVREVKSMARMSSYIPLGQIMFAHMVEKSTRSLPAMCVVSSQCRLVGSELWYIDWKGWYVVVNIVQSGGYGTNYDLMEELKFIVRRHGARHL